MKQNFNKILSLVVIASLLLVACAAPAAPAAQPPAGDQNGSAAPDDDLSQPNPKLSDPRIRKALAHCIDRDSLISSVYTYVPDDVKTSLRMDSFIPKSHWAYSGPYTDYEYNIEKGAALLEEAGWTLPEGEAYRKNAEGDTLEMTLTTTNSNFRQTWAAVVEQQLGDCGVLIIRQHTPGTWFFGDTTGTARRDFELGAWAWTGQADPSGRTLYACDQIPVPGNNWLGQNGMGWCNKEASDAIIAANNTLQREERIRQYDIVQKHFADDMVSLPLFQRAEAEAWSLNLEGMRSNPTEQGTASVANWKLTDGGDTVVVGFSQEPASMWSLVENALVALMAGQVGIGVYNTQYSYDYQPVLQDGLSTLESGLATNEQVKVKAGDIVYASDGNPVVLEKGVKVLINGQETEYSGEGELELPQLTVTYQWKPYTWSDGTPGSIEDFKLAFKINCDRESGSTSFNTCDTFGTPETPNSNVTYSDSELAYTIKFWPGVQDPTYHVAPFTISPTNAVYPSHQVLSDGRNLADVPAVEWATLPEIATNPLSFGPFYLSEWLKGQQMTFEVNPYYQPAPSVKKVVIVFVEDTNQLVAQFLSGDVDYVERTTLAGGAEVELVADAAKEGKVNLEIIPSATWEHMDMNLFLKVK